ncbi:hypothetical protein O3P69_015580 [Scylla paramamosain]|uniref:Uncharacterized protein n=1 Tax=Scylla paramamosain TaxID=85552 RepID=A0AAW0S8Q6_SCYPA
MSEDQHCFHRCISTPPSWITSGIKVGDPAGLLFFPASAFSPSLLVRLQHSALPLPPCVSSAPERRAANMKFIASGVLLLLLLCVVVESRLASTVAP